MHIRSYCISGVSGILYRSFRYSHGWSRSIGGRRIFPVGLAALLQHARLHSTSLGLLKIIYLSRMVTRVFTREGLGSASVYGACGSLLKDDLLLSVASFSGLVEGICIIGKWAWSYIDDIGRYLARHIQRSNEKSGLG
jgi:hypothetical protein